MKSSYDIAKGNIGKNKNVDSNAFVEKDLMDSMLIWIFQYITCLFYFHTYYFFLFLFYNFHIIILFIIFSKSIISGI